MQCREIATELDAYLTGELDADANAQVKSHLEGCASCRAELELLRKENALYHEYASTMAFSNDGSGRILALRARPKSAVQWRRWAAAAAVLAAVFVSWRFYPFRHDADRAVNPASEQAFETPIPVNQALRSYEQAVLSLQASYDGKKPSLDPALVRELDRNLRVAGGAVAECKLALEQHPNNPQVIEFLLLGYDKQLGILKQITEAL